MAEPSGTILIDDINIKDVSLKDLRSRIAVIPVIAYIAEIQSSSLMMFINYLYILARANSLRWYYSF